MFAKFFVQNYCLITVVKFGIFFAYHVLPDEISKGTSRLNEDQMRAVAAALNKSRPLITIHGPPGTGKTAVITDIVSEAVRRKQKVFLQHLNIKILCPSLFLKHQIYHFS